MDDPHGLCLTFFETHERNRDPVTGGPEDVAILLTSLVQGVAIRWTLGARGFALVTEGLRLFDVQMELLRAKEGACDA